MTRPMVRFHNTETNEITDREMNDEEFSQWQLNKTNSDKEAQIEAEKAKAKEALLDRLGITADEAKLLLS
jgi:hypothetical protein